MALGLTHEQIAQLRDDVAAGKSPRVRIAGSQFGVGAVRKVGDPAADGNDYVTVRVKVDGVTDDLRFAPRELSRGKNAPAKRPTRTSPAKRAPRESPEPLRADAARAGRRAATPATRTTVDPARETRPVRTRRKPASSSAAAESAAESAAASAAVSAAAESAACDSAGPASAARRPAAATTPPRRGGRKATSGAPVTITLKSTGTSWTVSAQRGAKSVARNVAVNPGVVSAVAGLLQVSSLEEAVAAVNDTARVEAEVRAEELRAELTRIQAVLDSHRLP
ncbi:hypothetical protein [uncultured Jatrophihabitans sp.]|uniref:hypothetical protein n=1 Tax=uncultured Jatrophihabitans sp. TaxID=1610747 RepID=UPI0035CB64DB